MGQLVLDLFRWHWTLGGWSLGAAGLTPSLVHRPRSEMSERIGCRWYFEPYMQGLASEGLGHPVCSDSSPIRMM